MSRPRAEMMPVVTVPPRPKGLPTAMTQSPTRGSVLANFTMVERLVRLDLDEGKIGLGIGADHLGLVVPCRRVSFTDTSSASLTTWLLVTA